MWGSSVGFLPPRVLPWDRAKASLQLSLHLHLALLILLFSLPPLQVAWQHSLNKSGKGPTENEMVGWHHQLNGHEFEQVLGVGDGQGSLACCNPWCLKESDMTEWLNWTESIPSLNHHQKKPCLRLLISRTGAETERGIICYIWCSRHHFWDIISILKFNLILPSQPIFKTVIIIPKLLI